MQHRHRCHVIAEDLCTADKLTRQIFFLHAKYEHVKCRVLPHSLTARIHTFQAYLCWEQAGQPQGADFAGDARRVIEERVKQGATYEQVARELKLEPTWLKVRVCLCICLCV
jgi:hypothetical protein